MKRGTKIGWTMIAISVALSIWVIVGQSSKATGENTTEQATSETGATETDSISSDDGELYDIPEDEDKSTESSDTNSSDSSSDSGASTSDDSTMLPSTETEMTLENGSVVTLNVLDANDTLGEADVSTSVTDDSGLTYSDSSKTTVTAYSGSDSSLTIPSTVTTIESGVFNSANNLTTFVVNGNSSYTAIAGNLYDSTGTTLVKVPNGATSATISSSTTTIGSDAFNGSSVSSITIPDSVVSIDSGAFTNSAILNGGTVTTSANSAADKYFSALNQNGANVTINYTGTDDPTDPDEPVNPDNPDNPSNNGGNSSNGGSSSGGSTSGGSSSSSSSGSSSSGSSSSSTGSTDAAASTINPATQQPAINQSAGTNPATSTTGGASGTSGGHNKDATPSTADGDIDPRLILCFATLAAGIGILLYTRSKKKVFVAVENAHSIDE